MLSDLFELLEYLAWLKSCEHLGHVPAHLWASSYTETEPPMTCPLSCLRCGLVLEGA